MCRSVAGQLREGSGTLQRQRRTRIFRENGAAPGCRIALIEEQHHRRIRIRRIAHEYRTIEEGAPVGLGDQVDRGGRIRAGRLEVIPLQDVQELAQHDAARRWRRGADYGEAAVGAGDRLAVEYLVSGQVLCGDERTALLDVIGELPGHRAGIESVRVALDALERTRQLRLLEDITLVPSLAV